MNELELRRTLMQGTSDGWLTYEVEITEQKDFPGGYEIWNQYIAPFLLDHDILMAQAYVIAKNNTFVGNYHLNWIKGIGFSTYDQSIKSMGTVNRASGQWNDFIGRNLDVSAGTILEIHIKEIKFPEL